MGSLPASPDDIFVHQCHDAVPGKGLEEGWDHVGKHVQDAAVVNGVPFVRIDVLLPVLYAPLVHLFDGGGHVLDAHTHANLPPGIPEREDLKVLQLAPADKIDPNDERAPEVPDQVENGVTVDAGIKGVMHVDASQRQGAVLGSERLSQEGVHETDGILMAPMGDHGVVIDKMAGVADDDGQRRGATGLRADEDRVSGVQGRETVAILRHWGEGWDSHARNQRARRTRRARASHTRPGCARPPGLDRGSCSHTIVDRP